jgi:hypothetical protein
MTQRKQKFLRRFFQKAACFLLVWQSAARQDKVTDDGILARQDTGGDEQG